MKIHGALGDQVAVLRLKGDMLGGPETDELVATAKQIASREHPALLINLADVPLINSLGLSAFIRVYKAIAEKHGRVCLTNLTGRTHTVFEIVKLSFVFDIYETEREGLATFEPWLAKTAKT